MKLHANPNDAPCKNMEALLQQVADGSATGIKKLYAVAHASQCPNCGNFLARLRLTLTVLRDSKSHAESNPQESLARLRAKIQELEKT